MSCVSAVQFAYWGVLLVSSKCVSSVQMNQAASYDIDFVFFHWLAASFWQLLMMNNVLLKILLSYTSLLSCYQRLISRETHVWLHVSDANVVFTCCESDSSWWGAHCKLLYMHTLYTCLLLICMEEIIHSPALFNMEVRRNLHHTSSWKSSALFKDISLRILALSLSLTVRKWHKC